jgi:hypothetical protein
VATKQSNKEESTIKQSIPSYRKPATPTEKAYYTKLGVKAITKTEYSKYFYFILH